MTIKPITRDDKLTLLFYLLNRQNGAIADCLRHIQGDKQGVQYSEDEKNGWVAHMGTELADTLAIVRKFCSVLDLDYNSIQVLGIARDNEKRKEYLARHPGAHWV